MCRRKSHIWHISFLWVNWWIIFIACRTVCEHIRKSLDLRTEATLISTRNEKYILYNHKSSRLTGMGLFGISLHDVHSFATNILPNLLGELKLWPFFSFVVVAWCSEWVKLATYIIGIFRKGLWIALNWSKTMHIVNHLRISKVEFPTNRMKLFMGQTDLIPNKWN